MTDGRRAAARAGALFRGAWGTGPSVIASAPGRVNLIGEHVDYNGGPVLPIAIDRRTVVAAASATGFEFVSELDMERVARAPDEGRRGHWSDYALGVVRELVRLGAAPTGARIAVASDVPAGGGLSSSAALTVATARALSRLAGARLSPRQVAAVAFRAEHDFVGVRCGTMDQVVIAHARAGTALAFDSGAGTFERVPFDAPLRLVDTGVRHRLTGGGYNQRRAECEAALDRLHARWPALPSLAALPPARLDEALEMLEDPLRRRVRHVVTETGRVGRAVSALRARRLGVMGRLLFEAHRSMAEDYEASCEEADLLVATAEEAGAWGARLTGAGWGGMVLVLAPERSADRIVAEMQEAFAAVHGRMPSTWSVRAAGGVRATLTD
ncbi:MAG TPA: galactokinase [Gemmatimonadales bacterium]|nr:galactokinase [Gemmatimonadales bacterium]